MNVHISVASETHPDAESAAGFLIGAGGNIDYRSASLIFHSWGDGAGLFAGIDGKGRLFIRDLNFERSYPVYGDSEETEWSDCFLLLKVEVSGGTSNITLKAVDPSSNTIISSLYLAAIDTARLKGNIALVSHNGDSSGKPDRFAFAKLMVSGGGLEKREERSTGPVISTQYTLSRKTLKITAQMAPLAPDDRSDAILETLKEGHWVRHSTSPISDTSYTAHFRVSDWNYDHDVPFRIVKEIKRKGVRKQLFEGIIKRDPVNSDSIVLLSLSCIEQVTKPYRNTWAGIDAGWFPFSEGILYPHLQLVNALKEHNPDLLFFAGDQVYEGASPTAADTGEGRYLDYLYKWYLWCITYRDLTATTPTVVIPDDHDVYHGNLWGAGGIATPPGLKGAAAQDAGGYKMDPGFVNMVQKTQTSHLPDPYDPTPAEQGISVYYTECNIGGVSFAIIEDRKFKSAPAALLPNADIVNGWPQNQSWNVKWNSRITGASLLGDRQMNFLEAWSNDWSGGTWMKAVLSQTLFANLATLPADATSDAVVTGLDIPDSGMYVTGDKLVTDFDSDGWPQLERNRALSLFRKAFALHVAGDQHLGSTVWYGIDSFRDAGYAIVSPATGNIFPRRWFPPYEGGNRKPGSPRYTGNYEDGFGNLITVMAVANPHKTMALPLRHNELAPGYSKIVFTKSTRKIELSNWPYYSRPSNGVPFPGWPIVIDQDDNYGKQPVGWLPEVRVEGIVNPVIRVVREITGEVIYTLRIAGSSYQPKVFAFGNYRIEVGDPDLGLLKTIEGEYPTTFKERKPVEVKF